MAFSVILKQLREDKNIRQSDLADILNISRQAISNYEQGTRFPKDEKLLLSIADFFNVSTDFLLGRKNTGVRFPENFYEKKEFYDPNKKELISRLVLEASSLSPEVIQQFIGLASSINKSDKKTQG
ncbi:helix-turn-helix domain-containing protein [Alkaliphilus sp. AH-315-G20]|nr:helix-turn-helix domain-containing protein [Alkaliphilus sp. AH-315-G20]